MQKQCPEGKILNPKTRRCVLLKHAAKHGIKHDQEDVEIIIEKKVNKPVDKPEVKCSQNKVLNPKTGRCVLKQNAHKYGIVIANAKKSPLKKVIKPVSKNNNVDDIERATVLKKEIHKIYKKLELEKKEYQLQQERLGAKIYGTLLVDLDKYISQALEIYEAQPIIQVKYVESIYDYENLFNFIEAVLPKEQKESFATFKILFKEKHKTVLMKLKPITTTIQNTTKHLNQLQKELYDIQKKHPTHLLYPTNSINAVSAGPGLFNNKYIIMGHGFESTIKFQHRRVVPLNQTLVVFPFCGLSNYTDKIDLFAEFFHNPQNSKILSEPLKYKDEIETLLGYPIRVYTSGDRMPHIYSNLFAGFPISHKYGKYGGISILKSGVIKAGNIQKIDRKVIEPSLFFGLKRDYAGSISEPVDYTKNVHEEVYKDNLYKPANEYMSFNDISKRQFMLHDVMNNIGNGVYYFVGCREAHGEVSNSLIHMSAAQQNKR